MFRRGGVSSVLAVRLLPVAPFTMVNIAAGVCRVRTWPFVAGSALGLAPGIGAVSLFGRQIRLVMRRPDALSVALLLGVAFVLPVGLLLVQRFASSLLVKERRPAAGPVADSALGQPHFDHSR